MNTQQHVAHYRVKNPVKSARENRRSMAAHYHRNPGRLLENESPGITMRTLQKVGKPLTKGLNRATTEI